jgi:hypothetical protein
MVSDVLHPCCTYVACGRKRQEPVKNTDRLSPRVGAQVGVALGHGQMAISAIGPAQIEDFKAHMRKKKSAARARKEAPTKAALLKRGDVEPKPLSLKTINNVLSALSKLLALAQE